MLGIIEKFKDREIKAKDIFDIVEINKIQSRELVKKFHYLGEKQFMYTYAYGLKLKDNDNILGAAVFGVVGGISALKGWFGLDNKTTDILELTRLVMNPLLNNTNATSYLLSNAIKDLKKKQIRAIVSLADSSLHIGYIYQACNFKYYGMTDSKTDFYCINGKLNPRGTTKNLNGVWLPRSKKHRYCYIIDKNIKVLYKQEPYPKLKKFIKYECCNGTGVVYDKRFNKTYTCPKCNGKLMEIKDVNNYDDLITDNVIPIKS